PATQPTTQPATQPTTQPATQPTTQPATQPTTQPADSPPAHPQLIEVRFDSLPSGSVFAVGLSAELCRTPCAFNIDLSDAGPTDPREFVVKRDGYADSPITVDLTTDKRAFHVLLKHTATTAQPDTEHAEHTEHTDRPSDAKAAVKADPKPDKRTTKRTTKTSK